VSRQYYARVLKLTKVRIGTCTFNTKESRRAVPFSKVAWEKVEYHLGMPDEFKHALTGTTSRAFKSTCPKNSGSASFKPKTCTFLSPLSKFKQVLKNNTRLHLPLRHLPPILLSAGPLPLPHHTPNDRHNPFQNSRQLLPDPSPVSNPPTSPLLPPTSHRRSPRQNRHPKHSNQNPSRRQKSKRARRNERAA
jgi:hypothetical protein